MTTATARRAAEYAALATLRDLFPIGSTVQTKVLHVSRSGMLRSFAVLVPTDAGSIRDVSRLVATVIGARVHTPTGGVSMGGCGMDMGYALAYSLSRALYRDGFPCTGIRPGGPGAPCPSNDHVNERMAVYTLGSEADPYNPGRMHSDPGYALSHRHI